MIKIKDIAPKPSDALQAMIDGLEEQSRRDDFIIDMNSFGEPVELEDGSVSTRVCCGCAATCALQKIAAKDLAIGSIETRAKRSDALDMNVLELGQFETAIDRARKGQMFSLFQFYGIQFPGDMDINDPRVNPNFCLDNDEASWSEQIAEVEGYILQLKAAGL